MVPLILPVITPNTPRLRCVALRKHWRASLLRNRGCDDNTIVVMTFAASLATCAILPQPAFKPCSLSSLALCSCSSTPVSHEMLDRMRLFLFPAEQRVESVQDTSPSNRLCWVLFGHFSVADRIFFNDRKSN